MRLEVVFSSRRVLDENVARLLLGQKRLDDVPETAGPYRVGGGRRRPLLVGGVEEGLVDGVG